MILGIIQLFFAAYALFISIIFIWTIVSASSFWKSLLIRWMICVGLLLHLHITGLVTGMTSGELEKEMFRGDSRLYNSELWYVLGCVIFIAVSVYTLWVAVDYRKKEAALQHTVLPYNRPILKNDAGESSSGTVLDDF